jgi:hypothetical protein
MIETIKNLYKEPIRDFFEKIKDINVENMPLINIPTIGCGYEKERVKIAIFGRDTNKKEDSERKEFSILKDDYDNERKNWEDIYDYLINPFKSMELFKDVEQNTFYGFVLKFLAEFYKEKVGGWQKWEDLKNKKEHTSILQSFILGDWNSFEINEKRKSESYGVNEDDWRKVKEASKSCFDEKLKDLINICKPDLLLILYWDFNYENWLKGNYKNNEWKEKKRDGHFYCVNIETQTINTLVYKVDHPTHMKKKEKMFIDKISRVIEDFNNRKSSIFS